MRLRNIFLVIVAIVAFASCKSQYEILLNSNDADLKYEAAFDYFNNGKFSKAASLFESLSVLTNGTERDVTLCTVCKHRERLEERSSLRELAVVEVIEGRLVFEVSIVTVQENLIL